VELPNPKDGADAGTLAAAVCPNPPRPNPPVTGDAAGCGAVPKEKACDGAAGVVIPKPPNPVAGVVDAAACVPPSPKLNGATVAAGA